METESSPSSQSTESHPLEEKQEQKLSNEGPRVDVSAATITRMMGIATVTDLKLLESRLDLIGSKVTTVVAKLDRVMSTVNGLPNGSDMDRLEIQLGSIKSVMKEILEAVSSGNPGEAGMKSGTQEQGRKLREGIRTNSDEG
jgi:hypothetical protein